MSASSAERPQSKRCPRCGAPMRHAGQEAGHQGWLCDQCGADVLALPAKTKRQLPRNVPWEG